MTTTDSSTPEQSPTPEQHAPTQPPEQPYTPSISRVPLIYVAGRFTGVSAFDRSLNVRAAEVCGMVIAMAGGYPVMPQSNTRNFWGTFTEEFWYDGTLRLLAACDAVIMANGWQVSKGAQAERHWAVSQHMPVFYQEQDYGTLRRWIEAWIVNRRLAKSDVVPGIARSPSDGLTSDNRVEKLTGGM